MWNKVRQFRGVYHNSDRGKEDISARLGREDVPPHRQRRRLALVDETKRSGEIGESPTIVTKIQPGRGELLVNTKISPC